MSSFVKCLSDSKGQTEWQTEMASVTKCSHLQGMLVRQGCGWERDVKRQREQRLETQTLLHFPYINYTLKCVAKLALWLLNWEHHYPVFMLLLYLLIPIKYAMWKREVYLPFLSPNFLLPFNNSLTGYQTGSFSQFLTRTGSWGLWKGSVGSGACHQGW